MQTGQSDSLTYQSKIKNIEWLYWKPRNQSTDLVQISSNLDLIHSSELLRVVTLSSACGRFTETAEEVNAYHHHFQNGHHGHQGHHCHQGHYGHIRVVKIIVLHHYHQHCFQVVSVLEKRKIKMDDKERKVFVNNRSLIIKVVEIYFKICWIVYLFVQLPKCNLLGYFLMWPDRPTYSRQC